MFIIKGQVNQCLPQVIIIGRQFEYKIWFKAMIRQSFNNLIQFFYLGIDKSIIL